MIIYNDQNIFIDKYINSVMDVFNKYYNASLKSPNFDEIVNEGIVISYIFDIKKKIRFSIFEEQIEDYIRSVFTESDTYIDVVLHENKRIDFIFMFDAYHKLIQEVNIYKRNYKINNI